MHMVNRLIKRLDVATSREVLSTATTTCAGCGPPTQWFMLIANRKDLPTLASLTPAPVIAGCEGKKVALLNDPHPTSDADCATAGT